MKRYLLVFLVPILFLTSCYYDSVEDLYPATCNTTDVSYSKEIVPILTNNCLGCHIAGSSLNGGVVLDNYAEVVSYATSGALVGSIKQESPYSPMPKSAQKMDDCKISMIDAWVKAGSPNN